MIEPNDDNIMKVLLSAFMIAVRRLSDNDTFKRSEIRDDVMIGALFTVDRCQGTNEDMNITELREAVTKDINYYNNSIHSQQTTQSTTTTNNNYYY